MKERAGFKGSGLVPYDPEVIISNLNIRLRTPTPPAPETLPWKLGTPSNAQELSSQNVFIKERIARHQDSSPTSINEAVNSFLKGARKMAHKLVLTEAEIKALRTANELLSKRRKRKKRLLKDTESLTVQEGLDIIAHIAINAQWRVEMRGSCSKRQRVEKGPRRCGRCREPGHRIETCPMDPPDTVE